MELQENHDDDGNSAPTFRTISPCPQETRVAVRIHSYERRDSPEIRDSASRCLLHTDQAAHEAPNASIRRTPATSHTSRAFLRVNRKQVNSANVLRLQQRSVSPADFLRDAIQTARLSSHRVQECARRQSPSRH